ncbi:MAG: hypothetical protein WBQ69_11940 [Gallionella sp.]
MHCKVSSADTVSGTLQLMQGIKDVLWVNELLEAANRVCRNKSGNSPAMILLKRKIA